MDMGTNARKTIMNQEVELKHGYIGIISRNYDNIEYKKRFIDSFKVNILISFIIFN